MMRALTFRSPGARLPAGAARRHVCGRLTGALAAIVLLLLPVVAMADSAVVFMYHRFGENQHPSTNVRMDAFRDQIELLSAGGFNVISLAQFMAWRRGEGTVPEKAIVLTIDDAYASIFTEAWPVLKAAAMPVTVFVSADPVDDGFADFLTWDQLRTLAGEGVTFANHGAGHLYLTRNLPGESDEKRERRVRDDLQRGLKRLHEELGDSGQVIDDVFAYPYGEYDEVSAGVVRSLGWTAFGQHSGATGLASDPLALPRFPINEAYSDLGEFRTKARSLPLSPERLSPWDPVVDASTELEIWWAPTSARLDAMNCFVSGQGRLEPEWLEAGRYMRVVPKNPLGKGRSRVNCTAPGVDGRYHWFSHQWIVQ